MRREKVVASSTTTTTSVRTDHLNEGAHSVAYCIGGCCYENTEKRICIEAFQSSRKERTRAATDWKFVLTDNISFCPPTLLFIIGLSHLVVHKITRII